MLDIYDGNRPISRRKLLTVGSLGLGGLALPNLLASKASGAGAPKHITGKSVIFLFQQGGPSQLETFDPKPDAPDGVRTVTGVTPTNVPGTAFGDTMQQAAKVADGTDYQLLFSVPLWVTIVCLVVLVLFYPGRKARAS